MYAWPYFQKWLPFLVIRRSKTPILHKKLSLFLAIKDHLLMIFDGKCADFAILKAAMYNHPIHTKINGIIFVFQFLSREFYMHVLILIFSKWTPRYHGNGRALAFKNLWNVNKHGINQFPKIWAKSVIFDFPRYYGPMFDAYSQPLLNVRLAGDHLYGKSLFTWLLLVMSMMVSFYAVIFSTKCSMRS